MAATSADDTVRFAAQFCAGNDCDLIILYVRPIDQGLHSGGLQVRLARQNMMEAGFELPGVRYLKRALEVLKEEGIDPESWPKEAATQDAWGDPAGDTKVEYKSPEGRSVVLKLKTAPDVANGILDQYELGPYNLMILGEPSRWRGEFAAFFDAGIVQQVTTLAPCSVLVVRKGPEKSGLLHLHRRHLALDAGGAPRRRSRPCHGRAHHAVFGGRHGARPGRRRRSGGQCQGAAQGHDHSGP